MPVLAVLLLTLAGAGILAWVYWSGRGAGAASRPPVPVPERTIPAARSYVWSATYSRDGNRLLSGDGLRGPGHARLWDVATGRMQAAVYAQDTEIFDAVFQPQGPLIALAGSDRGVHLLDPERPAGSRTFAHPSYVRGVAFSPDGKQIASQCEKLLQVWDVASGARLWQATVRRDLAWWRGAVRLAYAPDGSALAVPDGGRGVALFEARTGRLITTLAGHQNTVLCVAFAPEGGTIVSGGMDNTVRFWDAKGHGQRRTLTDAGDWVHALAFTPDGNKLAAASRGQGGVVLWEVEGGRVLARLPGEEVVGVAFSPDGETLGSASGDGRIRFWTVPPEQGR